jgi:hypothetical protein
MLDKLAIVVGVLFMLGAAPFIVDHVANHWYDDEYPHSGFTPDCPEWVAPEDDLYYLPEADSAER